MTGMDRDTLIKQYTDIRAMNWDYVKNRLVRITEDMRLIRRICELEGIAQEELDAAFEARQKDKRK